MKLPLSFQKSLKFAWSFLISPLIGALIGAVIGLALPLHKAFFREASLKHVGLILPLIS
jgi:uncharacterized membrane protein YgaE (UPF0421/DUF939 family)